MPSALLSAQTCPAGGVVLVSFILITRTRMLTVWSKSKMFKVFIYRDFQHKCFTELVKYFSYFCISPVLRLLVQQMWNLSLKTKTKKPSQTLLT